MKAKNVSDQQRDAEIAESLVLLFDSRVDLGTSAAIDSIADAFDVAGDPLRKIWFEPASSKERLTVAVAEAASLLSKQGGFQFFRAVPESETGNAKARWLTAAMAFANAPNTRVLFFGLPRRGDRPPFHPHFALLHRLVEAALIPQYGFGFYREYGLGPEYFALGHAFKTSGREIEQNAGRQVSDHLVQEGGCQESRRGVHRPR